MQGHKPSLSIIIGEMKKDQGLQNPQAKQSKLKELLEKSEGEDCDVEAMAYLEAMQALMVALKAEDAEAACKAFCQVMKECPHDGDHSDDEDYITNDDQQAGSPLDD